jgi:hypothetical protein
MTTNKVNDYGQGTGWIEYRVGHSANIVPYILINSGSNNSY